MRNLKKILALVLALVMSLSLMATAGAADFTDKADINADYQAAVDVLNGLEVFRGYQDGSFQPKGDITRAEVATIIYRIATADVKDTQAGIYTTWGKFADVKDTAWYAGYVNYCANAQIVKGKTATTFDPEARITGYQVLAMILRTMGYGKNGEFEGDNWAINTAAQAKQIGIIDGVTENLLGSNATREFVAQILFKAILISQVSYSALEGYKPTGVTLAKEKFSMERISGVVMANEYADLEKSVTLADGKTRMNVDGKDYTLNVTTGLEDIGESRFAYVIPDGKHSYNLVVDELYDTGRNVTAETGDAVSYIPSFASSEAGLSVTDDSEDYFWNFDLYTDSDCYSDYRIKYVLQAEEAGTNGEIGGKSLSDIADAINAASKKAAADAGIKTWSTVAVATDGIDADPDATPAVEATFGNVTVVLTPKTRISRTDLSWMRYIFGEADKLTTYELGEIYVGTQSTKDISDDPDYSYESFAKKFLTGDDWGYYFTSTGNGTWLKIIDNDNDGVAEYVFKTEYDLDEVKGYNSRFDYYTFIGEYEDGTPVIDLDPDGAWYKVNYGDYEPAIGDVVLAALIDGKWQVEPAPMETKTIKTVNFKAKTVTTTEDDTWNQSAISNWTLYADQILEMNEKTEYEIFFDKFDHIRAYRPVKGISDYALLSELYFTNQYNDKVIKNYTPIVEITIQDADTEEMPVSGVTAKKPSVFDGTQVVYTDTKHNRTNSDYLQRAINHLGIDDDTTVSTSSDPFNGDEFVYATSKSVSETNVAAYALTDDGESVALASASAFKRDRQNQQLFYSDLDKDGKALDKDKWNQNKVNEAEYRARHKLAVTNSTLTNAKGDVTVNANADTAFNALKPVYAVDYVQLDETKGVSAGAVRYNTHKDDCSYNLYDTLDGVTGYDGNYVNATHKTQYYIVEIDDSKAVGVSWFVDYVNLPKIEAGKITAMYAVASNTTADTDSRDYWVAEVIVIETTGVFQNYDSVALAYYNPEKTTGNVRTVEALDNMTTDPAIVLTPKSLKGWYEGKNPQWTGYGFYKLYDTEVDEPNVEADDIDRITKDYSDYGIHAATVTRDVRVLDDGGFIMIDPTGRYATAQGTEVKLSVSDSVKVYGVYTRNNKVSTYPVYELDDSLTVNDLKAGDEIIYVYNKNGTALRYIVIANYGANHLTQNQQNRNWGEAPWLSKAMDGFDTANTPWSDWNIWRDIINEQQPAEPVVKEDVVLAIDLETGEKATFAYEGQDPKTIEAGDADNTYTIKVPSDATGNTFHFTVEVSDGVKLAAIVSADGKYKMANSSLDEDTNTYTIYMVRVNLKNAPAEGDAQETEEDVNATIYTVAAVLDLLEKADEYATKLGDGDKTVIDDAVELLDILKDIEKNLIEDPETKEPVAVEGLDDAINKNAEGSLADELDTLVGDVAGAKETALALVTKAVGEYDDAEKYPDVAEAKGALEELINDCVTATEVEVYYDKEANPVALKGAQEKVKALLDAVAAAENAALLDQAAAAAKKDLEDQQKDARAAVDAATAGFISSAADDPVKAAAEALKGLIDRCVVNGVADAADAAGTDIATYWDKSGSALKAGGTTNMGSKALKALEDAITAAKGNVVTQAVANAKDEVANYKKADIDALTDASVSAYKTAIATAKTTADSAIEGVSDYANKGNIDAAVEAYEAAVDLLLAKANAVTAAKAHTEEATADLTSAQKTEFNTLIDSAKTAFEGVVDKDANKTEAEVTTALNTYKTAITKAAADAALTKITAIAVAGLTATAETGDTIPTSITLTGTPADSVSVGTVTWKKGDDAVEGTTFAAAGEYTVTITVTVAEGFRLTGDTTASGVTGAALADGKITVTVTVSNPSD